MIKNRQNLSLFFYESLSCCKLHDFFIFLKINHSFPYLNVYYEPKKYRFCRPFNINQIQVHIIFTNKINKYFETILGNQINDRGEQIDTKSDQWFGATVSSAGIDGPVVVSI